MFAATARLTRVNRAPTYLGYIFALIAARAGSRAWVRVRLVENWYNPPSGRCVYAAPVVLCSAISAAERSFGGCRRDTLAGTAGAHLWPGAINLAWDGGSHA